MTLAELKKAIENIESQLYSIAIPVRIMGRDEVNVRFNLEFDSEGKLMAAMTIYGVPELDSSRTPIRRRISQLEVGEEIEVSLDDYKSTSITNAACVIGRNMGRIYKTRSDWDNKVIRVIRVK